MSAYFTYLLPGSTLVYDDKFSLDEGMNQWLIEETNEYWSREACEMHMIFRKVEGQELQ